MLYIFSIVCMIYIMIGFLIGRGWLNDGGSEELNKYPVIVRVISLIFVLFIGPVIYLRAWIGGRKK